MQGWDGNSANMYAQLCICAHPELSLLDMNSWAGQIRGRCYHSFFSDSDYAAPYNFKSEAPVHLTH